MKISFKKSVVIPVLIVVAFIVWLIVASFKPLPDYHEKYEGVNLDSDASAGIREGTYKRYLAEYSDAAKPAQGVNVDIYNYTEDSYGVSILENTYDVEKCLHTDTESSVTWKVKVPEAGFYNIHIDYLAEESRGVAAERAVLINGKLPFTDAENLSFLRIWTDKTEPRVDNQKNEIRPTQVEIFAWQSVYFTDELGYIVDPYMFYFKKGENTLTIKGVNEPMAIKSLELTAVTETASYAEYMADNSDKSPAKGEGLTYYNQLEGEKSVRRSDSSLYAKYDKAAANTVPYSVTHTVLNYTGGDAWKASGQWIEWDLTVPEDGFYNVAIKGRQNYARGAISCRSLLIDNEIPFAEVSEIEFRYNTEWDVIELADENGVPYNFYLTKGTHTIRLCATLGGMGDILSEIDDSTYRLNQIYRKILVYTSANPDVNRDYHVEVVFEDAFEALELEYKRLYKIVDDTVAYTGQKSDQIASAQNLARQIERFIEKPNKLTAQFTNFKDNITSLGTTMLNMSEIKLDVDYIVVKGTDVKFKKDTTNFFKNAAHEIKAFVASFFVDYNALGDVYDKDADDVVKVWVVTGRDQGVILKTMIDDTYTPESGIKINLEIVGADAVLPAVLAGRGPDVVLSVAPDQPVNYALRNAALDITQFADYKEVLADFHPASYIQYEFDGGIYGVPETQAFSVMFYRKDILEELGLELPNTWQELIELLPTIQGNSMQVGLPTAAGSSGSALATATSSDLTLYFTLLYQNGGDVYNELGSKAIVDSEEAVKAFEDYSRYFTDYGCPTVFDFASRFRSGEMPIGIFPFSMYNTFMVSAPEIRGLWDFTLIPGTERTDAEGNTYIDRTSFVSAMATMMIDNEKATEEHKLAAWDFVKWWASSDTQVRYGREIEALLGASSRYNTANRKAFVQLAWSAEDIKILDEQWNDIAGIREVPGGYYTGRHITNAIRKVINEKTDPRETVIDYVILINNEITKKRKEFNLPLE